jgi:hypothetical protein
MSTFVLVHGAWQTASTWDLVGPQLLKLGTALPDRSPWWGIYRNETSRALDSWTPGLNLPGPPAI